MPGSEAPVDPATELAEAEGYFSHRRGIAALWFGMLAGPAAWFLHLVISYSLVRLICQTGDSWLLHLTTFATLLLAAAGVLVAWRNVRRVGHLRATAADGTMGRSRFMAVSGIALSGFFLIVVLLAWLPDFFLSPCLP